MKGKWYQIFILLSFILCIIAWNQNLTYQGNLSPFLTKASLYVEHNPIEIFFNGDFDTLGFSGSGTVDEPYLIENLNISGATTGLIYIRDTTVHFTIQNCFLNGTDDEPGIFFQRVKHCTIINNTINNSRISVRLDSSSDITVSNNSISHSNAYGVGLSKCDKNIISNNSISYSEMAGIALGESYYNLITNNIVTHYHTVSGIDLYNSSKNNITKNSISHGCHGITLNGDGNNSRNIISSNIISYNDGGWGIHLDENATNTLVRRNSVVGNTGYPSQANDDGVNNTFEYNYWDDWTSPDNDGNGIVDDPYSIQGIVNNQDDYPLTSPNTQPFSTSTTDTTTTGTTVETVPTTTDTFMETTPTITPLDPLPILVGIGASVIIRLNPRKKNTKIENKK